MVSPDVINYLRSLPTAEGRLRYAPEGFSIDAEPCTCEKTCRKACRGECGCEACYEPEPRAEDSPRWMQSSQN